MAVVHCFTEDALHGSGLYYCNFWATGLVDCRSW